VSDNERKKFLIGMVTDRNNILHALAEDPTLLFSIEALISLVRLNSTLS
jgi:hypothetical protein